MVQEVCQRVFHRKETTFLHKDSMLFPWYALMEPKGKTGFKYLTKYSTLTAFTFVGTLPDAFCESKHIKLLHLVELQEKT